MSRFFKVVFLLILFLLSACIAAAQDDEARAASQLPTFIGPRPGTNPNNSATFAGSVIVQGLDRSAFTPTLTVAIYAGGALIDRRPVQNQGSFAFNGLPRSGISLVVEADGVEVARYQIGLLNPPPLTNRQDIMLTSAQVGQANERRKEMVAILNAYQRSEANQKLFEKALSAGKDKKTDAARKLFKQLLDIDDKDFVAWTELGNLFFKADQPADAESAYSKALALKPDFTPALLNCGKLFLSQKNYKSSIELLEKAVILAPNSADVNHYLGEAYLQSKLGSKAVIYLNKAIELAPIEKAELHLRLAALYNAANLKDRAVSEYKLFLQKVPNYPEKAKLEKYISDNSPK